MKRLIAGLFATLLCLSSAAAAGERSYLGHGWLATNDLLGDSRDRWHTGSLSASLVWGPDWTGQLPRGFGRVLELRLGAEVVAPENLAAPAAGDRPFAGILSLGLHSHYALGPTEISIGADLAVTGPQTGLDDVQGDLHGLLGGGDLSPAARAGQIGNDVYPSLVVETGREFRLGTGVRLRPFVEGRLGLEDLMRVGADLTVGQAGRSGLRLRDPVTGQRYRAIRNRFEGLSLVMGADVAYVADSALLPEARGYRLTDARARARAGLHWQSGTGSSGFYGLTWLGEEFAAQREPQIVGSVRLNLAF